MKNTESIIFEIMDRLNNHGIDSHYFENSNQEVPMFVTDWNSVSKIYPNLESWMDDKDIFVAYDDETERCQVCDKGIYTRLGYYGDLPDYCRDDEGYCTCKECFTEYPDFDPYINTGRDYQPMAILPWMLPLAEREGFVCPDTVCKRYESGLHPGQNDNPIDAANELEEMFPTLNMDRPGDELEYIFLITGAGQFDIAWTVLIRLNN